MLHIKHFFPIIGAALIALLSASSSLAQTTGSKTLSEAASGQTGSVQSGGQISKDDRDMMEDLAKANLAEIDTGKIAQDKAQNDQVKKFAQMMLDDHTTALKELQTLAQSKGVTLTKETDLRHKTIATALKALSGETFDEQYISRVGVGDHERTRDLLQKVQKNTNDAELKTYAQKTLKVVEQHLAEAKKLKKKK